MEKIRYTGQPFVDIGLAAILAFVQKSLLDELKEEDLERVATYIEQNYVLLPLRSFLTVAFTSNAWFMQDAFNPEKPGLSSEERERRQAKRTERAARHIYQWKSAPSLSLRAEQTEIEPCIFTDSPAIPIQLSEKLEPGRAARAQFPMTQGDESINFSPYGFSGIPVSGVALLALQFFPLACARCGHGLLALHSDNEALTLALASLFLQQTIHDVTRTQIAHEEKLPKLSSPPKTALIEAIIEVERQRLYREEEQEPASLTAYDFNNGKTQQLAIYYLPFEIVQFLRLVRTPLYEKDWQHLSQRGWLRGGAKYGQKTNALYEDLFTLPGQGVRFTSLYFVRPAIQYLKQLREQSEGRSQTHNEVHWILLVLFLEKVLRMDTTRLALIEKLGDDLAAYVKRQGGRGKRFFQSFFTEQRTGAFRTLLIKVNLDYIKDRQPSLFDMATYLTIFEEGEEVFHSDWRFARDLVLMRMIDQLQDWLAQNPDVTTNEEENEERGDTERERRLVE